MVLHDYTVFLTAWFYTTDPDHGEYSGWGNPSNTNTGFVQMYDMDSSTVTSSDGYWDPTPITFSAFFSGENASADEYSRLWPAPLLGGAATLSGGTVLTYEFGYQAQSDNPAILDGNGWFYTDQHPVALSGYFRGTFENTSPTSSVNGVYAFDFVFGLDNWAWDNRESLNGPFGPSFFAATEVRRVPEPLTLSLLGLGLLGAGFRARRQR